MIIRIFRASVHDGKQAEFKAFFTQKALPMLLKTPGCVDAKVGLPTASTPNEFAMVMIWDSIESIKKFSGENWETPKILPEEEHLLKATFAHHFEYFQSD